MVFGLGVVNCIFDDFFMNFIVVIVNIYIVEDVFVFVYNIYVFLVYNIFFVGFWIWYVEVVYKIDDNLSDFFGEFVFLDFSVVVGDKLYKVLGMVFYSSLSYVKSGLGIFVEGKCMENFDFWVCLQE